MNLVDELGFSIVGDVTECEQMKYKKKYQENLHTIALLNIYKTVLDSHWKSLEKIDDTELHTGFGHYMKWIYGTPANKIDTAIINHFNDIENVQNQIYELTGKTFVTVESADALISELKQECLDFESKNKK